jgi:type II secretory pathway component GspD/PulD (secretin)
LSRLDVSYEKVGVKLKAKPKILDLAKERIELQIDELDLSSVTGYVTLQNVNRPIFAKSSANTRVEINNGETFILGGFKIKRDVVKESGVPFLRRIPILGYLFKSEKKVQENKDVLFFITPYLLDPGVSPILPYDFQHGQFLEIKNIPVQYE